MSLSGVMRFPKRTISAACLVLAVSACASACADNATPQKGGAQQKVQEDEALHAALPSDVRSRGVLRILTDASYAPASSFASDGRTIIGFEPDLGAALGATLGVRVQFVDHDFDDLPAAVSAGKAELIMSAMTDTAEREKALDFVDYFSAGTSVVVQRGNPAGITDLRSMCGLKVAVEKGTVQADLLVREQKQCGRKPVDLIYTRTNDDALLQVRTGRAAAVPMDFPPAELLTTSGRTSHQYQLASTDQYEPGPYGIGMPKGRSALRASVRDALAKLMRDGVYQQILRKWNVEGGALRTVTVNAAAPGD